MSGIRLQITSNSGKCNSMKARVRKKAAAGHRNAQRLGRYPNVQDHRIRAGLEISDLVTLLGDAGPKERSLRRLEVGQAIRLAGVFRVFHVLNERLGKTLKADDEIVE